MVKWSTIVQYLFTFCHDHLMPSARRAWRPRQIQAMISAGFLGFQLYRYLRRASQTPSEKQKLTAFSFMFGEMTFSNYDLYQGTVVIPFLAQGSWSRPEVGTKSSAISCSSSWKNASARTIQQRNSESRAGNFPFSKWLIPWKKWISSKQFHILQFLAASRLDHLMNSLWQNTHC